MEGFDKMKFNEKIIMLRKNKNLSQEDLGNELGLQDKQSRNGS